MKLKRDPRLLNFPDLLSADIDDSAIAWTGDQHYQAVFKPEGNLDTPLLGIYPMGSPCDQSLVEMFTLAKKLLAEKTGPALYEVPFSGFTDHRGMDASGQGFSNAYKFTTAWTVQGTIGLMTPWGILAGGGCDKSYPMLLHTMGIEPYRYMPWALLHSGHRSVGKLDNGHEVTFGDLANARVRYLAGQTDAAEVQSLRERTVYDVGVCENLASAMSQYLAMCCGGFILAGEDLHGTPKAREVFTRQTVALYRDALEQSIVPADVINKNNFENYTKAIALFGLSTNLPLHMPFITKSWGLTYTPASVWSTMKAMPWICDLQPIGKYTVNNIGSMLPSVIKYLVSEGILDDVTTLFGPRLSNLYKDAPDLDFNSQKIFYSLEKPLLKSPAVVLYTGNLCPGGAWVKEGKQSKGSKPFSVHMCENQTAFYKDTQNGTDFKNNTCYVITGDQSTVELLTVNYTITAALEQDPELDILLLTDQRTSGFAGTRAKAAYHLPRNRLRQLQNGEQVEFSMGSRQINLLDERDVPNDALMNKRAEAYIEPEWPKTGTVKDLINKRLTSAEDGAAVYD